MKPLRVLALMHQDLVPPDDPGDADMLAVPWKTEFDVVSTLREVGHEVRPLGVRSDLGVVRQAIEEFQPHIAFNLLEEFDGVARVVRRHQILVHEREDAQRLHRTMRWRPL